MRRLLLLIALHCPAGIASAAVLQDFNGAWTGTGAIVTDPINPLNKALKIVGGDGPDAGADHDILRIPIPSGTYGTVTMDIFDFGAIVHDSFRPNFLSDNGPRWGIVGDSGDGGERDHNVAVGLTNKTYLLSNEGYAISVEDLWTGDWASLNFFANGPRRVKTDPPGTFPISGNGLQKIGTGTPTEPETPGTGAWTTWVFDIAQNGDVTITAKAADENTAFLDDVVSIYHDFNTGIDAPMHVGALTEIWVSGGPDNAAGPLAGQAMLGVHGVLVDNITFTGPAVATVPGDYNGNDVVDAADYVVWRDSMGQTGDGLAADGDGNGAVETADYVYWKTRFGNTSGSGLGSGSAVVPEPACFALFAAALLSAWGLRRRGA